MPHKLTAILHREALSNGEPIYVAHCPELDVTSQGDSETTAIANLREAIEGFLEVASPTEIAERWATGGTVATFEIAA